MREYDSIVYSTLCIPASKVPEAIQALKNKIEVEEPEKTYEGLLPLLRDRFAWDGAVQSDGAVANLCPIEKERVDHEDWHDLLALFAPFVLNETFIEYLNNDEGIRLRYLIKDTGVCHQQQVITVTWRDCVS